MSRSIPPRPEWLPARESLPHLLLVGVVGGVAAGKSTAARTLEELGALRLDADEAAGSRLVEEEVLRSLREMIGESLQRADGSIDRARIAEWAFADPERRKRLEALIHPAVRDRFVARLEDAEREAANAGAAARSRPVVLDVPLLIESGWHHLCDRVVFLEAPLEERDARAVRDRGWASGEVARREAAQVPLEAKRRLADRVVPTEDVAVLRRNLAELLEEWLGGNAPESRSPEPPTADGGTS